MATYTSLLDTLMAKAEAFAEYELPDTWPVIAHVVVDTVTVLPMVLILVLTAVCLLLIKVLLWMPYICVLLITPHYHAHHSWSTMDWRGEFVWWYRELLK